MIVRFFLRTYLLPFIYFTPLVQPIQGFIKNSLEHIPKNDDIWCEQNCHSLSKCLKVFGDDHADLRLRINFSVTHNDALGESLTNGNFFGNTISKQSFETQFVLDVSSSLSISPCRLYVVDLLPETNGHFGEHKSVQVTFYLFPADTVNIRSLTMQVQKVDSVFYAGKVTVAADPLFGVIVLKWDVSIKLAYAIAIIAGDDAGLLYQGSERFCDIEINKESMYCDFENMFKEDISRALSIQSNNVDLVFIKTAGEGSVLVTFRFIPTHESLDLNNNSWIDSKVTNLIEQIHNTTSALYSGNVTYRVDATWGVSGGSGLLRSNTKRLSRSVQTTSSNIYARCKSTNRCSQGWSKYLQTSASLLSTMQYFAGGKHIHIPLFADFEDWRQGTYGWWGETYDWENSKDVYDSKIMKGDKIVPIPKGAHFSPFNFVSLGPSIPSFNSSLNNGLVLNRVRLMEDIKKQSDFVESIEVYLVWIELEMTISSLDAKSRSRKDIQNEMMRTKADSMKLLTREREKLILLSNSQCQNEKCTLLFNTSSLELRGAINATGTISMTPDGTEVAIWTFDSIDLGSEVIVTLTGQRAIFLLSKSSTHIDTKLHAYSGTLGGFPGGFSVFRDANDLLVSVCPQRSMDIDRGYNCDGGTCCPGDQPLSRLKKATKSNNVNGPGSSSVRVYLHVIETSAKIVREVQMITTTANKGQVIGGGFKLHFNGYTSSLIPYDISAFHLKRAMEDSLNAANINMLHQIDRRNIIPGIGVVKVSRESYGTNGGYQWKITFASTVGDIDSVDSGSLTATNMLNGIGSSISIATITNGNSIGGTFSISFLGSETRPLFHDVSSEEMQSVIISDIPSILSATVIRNDRWNNCNDGLCEDGPQQAGGYSWTLTITTELGNISPFSPTSILSLDEGKVAKMVVHNSLTGCVQSDCPLVTVSTGHGKSVIMMMRSIVADKPFSLAFGGTGGSYGGKGGEGYGINRESNTYGEDMLLNLHGGSGGGLGFIEPFHINMATMASKVRGGSGGGAIGLVAINDVVLGPNSAISCCGEDGSSGFMTAGGGGSGGSILLSAGGVLKLNGTLVVAGGNGGTTSHVMEHSGIVGKREGGGGGGGRIAMFGQRVSRGEESHIDVSGGICPTSKNQRVTKQRCVGQIGTIYEFKFTNQEIYVDKSQGALGTESSLYLKSTVSTEPYVEKRAPEFVFHEPIKPGRVSFFVKFACRKYERSMRGWGISFELRSKQKFTSSLRLSIGHNMKHGIISHGGRHKIHHLKDMRDFYVGTNFDQWYKIDVRLDWKTKLYDIYMEDSHLVKNAHFDLKPFVSITALSHASNVDTWIDEVFVGEDASTGFRCPGINSHGLTQISTPRQSKWKSTEVGGDHLSHDMQHHESHLSQRPIYSRSDNGGLLPFDGEGHHSLTSNTKFNMESSENAGSTTHLIPGSLLTVFKEQDINRISVRHLRDNAGAQTSPTYYWYGEHDSKLAANNEYSMGGVAACSTIDFKTWKNEGIMLNYSNLTNMVLGSTGPFHAERPKVIYNAKTGKYIMWMVIDNEERTLAMSGVAISDYANGPFNFIRSFFPDGNKTRDQTLLKDSVGAAYLVRTYYETLEVTLPSAVMQPIWESVKNIDGTTNFPLTHHRANYEQGYDNFHDIYLQRWRSEDRPWKVICINRVSGMEREVLYNEENSDSVAACLDPFEFKQVLGQGSPLHENAKNGIQSRFLDPTNSSNSIWRPDSVPGVKSQTWSANYQDGVCGKRKINDDMQLYEPNLRFKQQGVMQQCSNAVDNPFHGTPPDERVGVMQIVEKRRSKFISISSLSDSYLETTGVLKIYEGELEEGVDLLSILNQDKDTTFRWSNGETIQSTYVPILHNSKFEQTSDWDSHFHQYENKYNDRAFYSLACVVDGKCPVNFRDQIKMEHS